ncbi:MAG: SDR family NAD(P)-dependent oxidoreductase, partial [Burkholderiales bacterium]|nr:SDR family NAD(P)-dependent oxidoreductase [Burkholderiales bacterium]
MNRLDFEGRTAVVTGGAAGIGLAVAKRLVLSGARVALWDLDAKALATAAAGLGHGTDTQTLDVADAHAVERAAAATAKAFGRIDALVCSAGIAGPNRTT